MSSSRYQAKFHVASAYFALIIGKKGATKKRIEMETKTRITIPKQVVAVCIVSSH
jgi:activating signal cointegrator complex subunit 1